MSVAEVASQITDGLWQGGLGPWAGCPVAFNDIEIAVVLCSTDRDDDNRKVRVMFPDPVTMNLLDSKSDLKHGPELKRMAKHLAKAHHDGANIGIFCWQGRNRSGLLTALTLREITGCSGLDAIHHIRSCRPEALDTESGAYERWLAAMPPKRR